MRENRYGKRVIKVVLTGGPCAGKSTTARNLIQAVKQDFGAEWQTFVVAEASTLLYTGGVHRPSLSPEQLVTWQEDILKTIFQLEQVYDNIATLEKQKHTLIICDRGALDPKVFAISPEAWTNTLNNLGTPEKNLINRYDAVLQLFTAPKENYTKENNSARRECFEEANAKNKKYTDVWYQHPRFVQIENLNKNGEHHWDEKFSRVYKEIQKLIVQNS